ncbi:S8 family serine peptidase [Alienimonas californiensis]|uniref:Subtilisin E n=1 Tax=Alienimonas californiensis TaxID=2527989 RepID=A0A517PBJ4_9PLAN|nr:S8 family serine peptidase [Alienimonas californiensis]QDT16753.1 Subtilisin E precursor [Alienimonas californiensis]
MPLTRTDVTALLFAGGGARRFTQDSPVLPDVWVAYAQSPNRRLDLLLTPYHPSSATDAPHRRNLVEGAAAGVSPVGRLATYLKDRLPTRSNVGQNQTGVVARCDFETLVRVLLPASSFWDGRLGHGVEIARNLRDPVERERLARLLAADARTAAHEPDGISPGELWLLRVVGTLAELRRAGAERPAAELREEFVEPWLDDDPPEQDDEPPLRDGTASGEFRTLALCRRLIDAVGRLLEDWDGRGPAEPLLYQVGLNRPARLAVRQSARAVKADAVVRLFETRCSGLTWAVLDDGIDRRHPAFADRAAGGTASRVRRVFDFTQIRHLLAEDGWGDPHLPLRTRRRLDAHPGLRRDLRRSLSSGRSFDWSLVQELIEVGAGEDEEDELIRDGGGLHGTHVAGILAADWRPDDLAPPPGGESVVGLCPDLNLIDLRVIDARGRGDEFAVIAALQFVRHLNATAHQPVVHGVNVSLAIAHDVTNYACGRTPVCLECERLVGDGVVVVAAAGNEGYAARDGAVGPAGLTFGGDYRTSSISDPGNAEAVLTVGATHRSAPHSYGVSYFSGRGPTGDGRAKPDLVAPGEKIVSCAPNGRLATRDGTSMAAPHVSGAAALLMARNAEFIGRPARVKDVLCRSATDLGRERYFQGHGMLDVLRALQAV